MEFLQSHYLNQFITQKSLIGGILHYFGLNLKITKVVPNE